MVDAHSGVFEVSTHVRAGFLSKKNSLPDISVKRAEMTLGSGTLEEPDKKLSGTSAGRSSNEIRHKRGPEWRLSNRAADANAGAELRHPCRIIRHVARAYSRQGYGPRAGYMGRIGVGGFDILQTLTC